MTDMRGRAARGCLRAMAVLWPLDVAAAVWPLPFTLTAVAATALVFTTVLDLSRAGKLRLPFEYLASIGIMGMIAGGYWVFRDGDPVFYVEALGALAVFVCVTHWARGEAIQKECLLLSLNSGLLAVFASLAWLLFGGMPASYASPWGIELPYAFDVPSGLHVVLLVGAIAVFASGSPLFSPFQRALSTLVVALAVCFALAKTIQALLPPRGAWTPILADWSPVQVAAFALPLWLWARVLAKVNIRAREESLPLARLALWTSLATLALLTLHSVPPRLFHGFVLGLIAAGSLPVRARVTESKPRVYGVATVAAVVLLAIPAITGGTAHPRDERNYDLLAQREFQANRYAALSRRMDAVVRYYPGEQGAFLWRAKMAMKRDNIHKAVVGYCLATQPSGARQLHTVVSPARREAFLSEMRDRIAYEIRPEQSPAYVRILAAHGEPVSALAYLEAQVGGSPVLEWNGPRELFAGAVAGLVQPGFDTELLDGVEVGHLRQALVHWGAREIAAPVRNGERGGYFVVVAQRWARDAQLSVYGEESTGAVNEERVPVPWQNESTTPKVEWSINFGDDRASWTAQLHDETGDVLATVQSTADGHTIARWEEGGAEALPYTPAILIVVPDTG